MVLRLSDFEAEDQQVLKPTAKAVPPADTFSQLTQFAKQQGYRVTSGKGGRHNTGSKHYRGEAIDIDHRGIDYNKLLAAAQSKGYRVLDERTHPKGQKEWGGPHFHIEVGGKPKAAAQKPKPKEIASQSGLIAPFDVSGIMRPSLQYDQNGVLVQAPQSTRDIGSEISKAVKPEPKRQVAEAISLSDFDLDQNDLAEIQAMADRLKPKVEKPDAAQVQSSKPETNFFGDLYNHALNAAAGYSQDDLIKQSGQGVGAFVGDIAGGLVPIGAGTLTGGLAGSAIPGVGNVAGGIGGGVLAAGAAGAAQDLQAQRLAGAKEIDFGRAAGAGAIQGALQAIPGVGQAKPLLQRLAANAAVQGVGAGVGSIAQQGFEQGTFLPNVDLGRVGSMAALGAAGGVVGGATMKPKAAEVGMPSGFVNAKGQEIIPGATHSPHGFVREGGTEIAPRLTPQEQALLKPQEPTYSANPEVLKADFAARQEAPQIIDPRTQPLPKELGDLKTEATDSGVIVATKAGQKEIPQIEVARGLPEGERVDIQKPLQTENIIDPTTGQPYKAPERRLRPTRELALERAEAIAKRADDVNVTEPQRIPDNPSTDLPNPVPREVGQSVLDSTGKPIARELSDVAIERPNQPRPVDPNALEIPKPFERPQLKEVGEIQPPAQPGAYTDTINELLKDTGLDWAGVQKLKKDIDTRRGLLNGTLKNSRSDEAKRLRTELKDLNERWKALDSNIQEAVGLEFDPQTGLGQQRDINPATQFNLDQVRGDLSAPTVPIAERINEALQKGVKVRLKYIAEQTGRSQEVAKLSKGGRAVVQTTEFSPTHFGYTNATYAGGKRRVPVVHGYNQRGHEVMYYLEKSPKGSQVQQVVSITDKPAFQGPVPNIAKGPGQYSLTDMLARGPRTERGFVKTSEAIKAIHEQKLALRDVASNAILPSDAKQSLQKVFSGQDLSYDDIRRMRKTMSDPKQLTEFCTRMGLR